MGTVTHTMDAGSEGESVDPASRVVERVADAKDVDSVALDPIFEAIDSDALNDLLGSSKRGTKVTFEYEGYRVSIRDDRRIELAE
ncbi:HalOD1 output domain-containing protein [Haloarchaeobius sp. HRN-SO-5]|uniref:HalOD1 output domain-containing protein n=1 Tax=Haloarchaeobius sp. HRN-SO-5 TaxID=3446118 RepID=UPI003EB73A19